MLRRLVMLTVVDIVLRCAAVCLALDVFWVVDVALFSLWLPCVAWWIDICCSRVGSNALCCVG